MGSDLKRRPLKYYLSEKPRNGLYKGKEFQGSGSRWIKMNEIFSLNFISDDETSERIEVTKSEEERFSCYAGDLLFGRTSLTLEGVGDCSLVQNITDAPIFESNLFRLRFNSVKASSIFFYYFFKSHYGRQLIQRIAKQTAATSITASDLIEENVPAFSLSEQIRIADLIHQFDLKITLNHQINQTLEQMAQALFKSWFVDFDPVIDNALDAGNPIPDALAERAARRQVARANDDFQPLPDDVRQLFSSEFEDSELGWIPEGWEAVSVIDLIQLIGGGTPKTSIDEYWNGDIPWFSVVDAPVESNVFVIDTEKHVTDLGVQKSSTKVLSKGTTIISARGTVGKCAMVARPMAMNQSCYGIQGIEGITDEFTYYLTRHSVSQLQQKSHGSVFSTITRDTFRSLGFVFCGGKLTGKFSNYVAPMFDKILSNNLESIELEKLRDTLLPKLISGELRLDSVEVEQAKSLLDGE